jgi:hypothetical protein
MKDTDEVTGEACMRFGMRPQRTPLGQIYYATEPGILAYRPVGKKWHINGASADIEVKTVAQLRHLLIGLGLFNGVNVT